MRRLAPPRIRRAAGALAAGACIALAAPTAGTSEPRAGASTHARVGAVTQVTRSISTPGGTRPFHIIRFPPGRGVRLEAVWLAGGPGRVGTVGAYVRANARRGALGGLNGDFFLLAAKRPSGNLFLHRGRSFLGNTERGAAVIAADGSVDIRPGGVRGYDLVQQGVREATSGKPVYVDAGRVGQLATLEPYQRNPPYHRSAVGRLKNGDSALVVVGGAGLSASAFARGLIRLGFEEALGMDIDSSANLNWRGGSVNRPSYQRQIPTGIIVFRTP